MKFQSIPLTLAVQGDTTQKLPSDGQSVTGDTASGAGASGSVQSAQGQSPLSSNGNSAPSQSPLPMALMLGVGALFIFMMFNGQRREKKRQAKLLASVSKGCKVVTAGGIIGNVVEVRDNEVVVKVDENANTRIRFTKEAIKSVIQNKND